MRPQLVAATPGRMIDVLSEEPLKASGQAISTVGVVAHTANVSRLRSLSTLLSANILGLVQRILRDPLLDACPGWHMMWLRNGQVWLMGM